jgi:aryl-alcohol dehydrogenase-like predicted oxidoreductase
MRMVHTLRLEMFCVNPDLDTIVVSCPKSLTAMCTTPHRMYPNRDQVTLFDSAEGYGGGTSEARLGRLAPLAHANRATKSTTKEGEEAQQQQPLLMTKFLPTPWRFTKGHFEAALRASLARLRIDSCPIYLLHTPVHWRPIEFWVEAAADCKRKGLLQAFGLSNCDAEQVRRAHAAGVRCGVPVVVNQVRVHRCALRCVAST